jgi:hypothetical protein
VVNQALESVWPKIYLIDNIPVGPKTANGPSLRNQGIKETFPIGTFGKIIRGIELVGEKFHQGMAEVFPIDKYARSFKAHRKEKGRQAASPYVFPRHAAPGQF